jgi:hypothetical protein
MRHNTASTPGPTGIPYEPDRETDADHVLPVHILPQPDLESCGPTCLHAVYRFWGDKIKLPDVIQSAKSLRTEGVGRGTLANMLGSHALKRGYHATIYTFNLHLFDPTWFDDQGHARRDLLIAKLRAQSQAKSVDDPRFQVATDSYLEFLELGGDIAFRDPSGRLITSYLRRGIPVLAVLSATYLYRCAREFGPNDDYDDIRGEPSGHFVVVHGYDPKSRTATIADPLADNPGFDGQRYTVKMNRLIPAIMLGVLTYDSNLLVIEPRPAAKSGKAN